MVMDGGGNIAVVMDKIGSHRNHIQITNTIRTCIKPLLHMEGENTRSNVSRNFWHRNLSKFSMGLIFHYDIESSVF